MIMEHRKEGSHIAKTPDRYTKNTLTTTRLLVGLAACISAMLLLWIGYKFYRNLESPLSDIDGQNRHSFNLILVNPWNNIPDDYQVLLQDLGGGEQIDRRCYPPLEDMLKDCRAAGLDPLICSAYRSNEMQKQLFENQVGEWLSQGYSLEEAKAEAGKVVAAPGTSEHQLGLAVDIVDVANQMLDESQENTPVQQWLMKNSWKYGFILRYPNNKSDITGIIYEPWHYRYVGKDVAAEIYEQGLCLEEYLRQ